MEFTVTLTPSWINKHLVEGNTLIIRGLVSKRTTEKFGHLHGSEDYQAVTRRGTAWVAEDWWGGYTDPLSLDELLEHLDRYFEKITQILLINAEDALADEERKKAEARFNYGRGAKDLQDLLAEQGVENVLRKCGHCKYFVLLKTKGADGNPVDVADPPRYCSAACERAARRARKAPPGAA